MCKNNNHFIIKFSTDNWELRKLSELARFAKGTGFSKSDLTIKGIPIILYGLMYTQYHTIIDIVHTYVDSSSDGILSTGKEVIVPASGETAEDISRASAITKSGILIGGDINIIYPNKDIDQEFLALSISNGSQKVEMIKRAQGASIVHLHNKDLKQMKLIFPEVVEQLRISNIISKIENLIALQQSQLLLYKALRKSTIQKVFPLNREKVPKIRFIYFDEDWKLRELGCEFKKANERNDGSFGKDKWISVAKMYFQDPDKVQSNNIYTRTYVMRKGSIAFEGHPNNDFKFGRFVANNIGDGVVSELFPIYKHIVEYDNNYWKHAIQLERIMAPIFAKSITSSGNSSNKLDSKHFLKQKIFIPNISEQHKIGKLLKSIDDRVDIQQKKIEKLKSLKKYYLQKLFV